MSTSNLSSKSFWTEVLVLLGMVFVPFLLFRETWSDPHVWLFLAVWTPAVVIKAYFNNQREESNEQRHRNKIINTVFVAGLSLFAIIMILTSCSQSVSDADSVESGLSNVSDEIIDRYGVTPEEFGELHNQLLGNFYQKADRLSATYDLTDEDQRAKLITDFVDWSVPILKQEGMDLANRESIISSIALMADGLFQSYITDGEEGGVHYLCEMLESEEWMGKYVFPSGSSSLILFDQLRSGDITNDGEFSHPFLPVFSATYRSSEKYWTSSLRATPGSWTIFADGAAAIIGGAFTGGAGGVLIGSCASLIANEIEQDQGSKEEDKEEDKEEEHRKGDGRN